MGARKGAVVTGSTSGIGLGIARALAAQGADLMLNGLETPGEVQELCAEITKDHGVEVRYSSADMADGEQVRAMIAEAESAFEGVDILVNNAGIQHVAEIEAFAPEKWDAILAINLSAAFHSTAAALPGMKARGFGRVINIASAHALVASPYKSAYVAAKHGVAGLTKTVALESAEHGVTVNAVCPGYVLTPLVENQIPETARARGISEAAVKRDVLLAAQPTKQFVEVEQIAALVTFLASPAAASITGAVLPMDGGWTAQ
ncbi:3-hydroxybutyrate dehydrogenase [Halorhodospira neutriphila]|uniref:3-hydroxybutyrate dehydrogenase n=1 Tax=Halorhodospira neutriphila TaxID=168379 RepID=A0ABS1E3P2_9GAMM|nr:3-hydroxybutyrate dehydrogenase [Halorhodospira neutriphila]MBK1726333.1 3-hydroxybutyrate dehydrogenase [Halorhodospira neutriphila]